MPSRVIMRGQTAWASRDYRPLGPDRLPRRRDGSVIEDERIQRDSPDSPFRAGVPYYDADDEMEYRAVSSKTLDPAQGWRTSDFWVARWSTDWRSMRVLVEKGWLDAAIEHGSAVKRFRCRDEHRVLKWLADETRTKEKPLDHRGRLRRDSRR